MTLDQEQSQANKQSERLTPLQTLQAIVSVDEKLGENWAARVRLRAELLSQLSDPTVDTSELRGLVTMANRKAKLDLPEIVELRQQIAELQSELYLERQQAIYDKQIEIQLAEEQMAALLHTELIGRLQTELALLEHEHALAQPELTSHVIIKKSARALVARSQTTQTEQQTETSNANS